MRRGAVAVLGVTLLAVGAVLVFTPGPAVVVLSLGLGVLALEFAWARRWLRKLRATANDAVERVRESGGDADRASDEVTTSRSSRPNHSNAS